MRLRNIAGSREVIADSAFTIKEPEKKKGLFKKEVFGNDNPIHVEIGMGKGRFLMDMAQLHPDINYVGIEKYSSVLIRALAKQEEIDLPNLRFLRLDAETINIVAEEFGFEDEENTEKIDLDVFADEEFASEEE